MGWTRPFFSAIGWCFLPRVPAASKRSYRYGCQGIAVSRAAPKPSCSNTFRSKFGKRWNGLLKQKDSRRQAAEKDSYASLHSTDFASTYKKSTPPLIELRAPRL